MGMWGDIGGTVFAAGGATKEIGMTLIGRLVAQGDYDRADALYQEMIRDMNVLEVPEFDKLVAQEVQKAQEIPLDSQGRQAQMNAIGKLQALVDQGGLDAQARQALQQSMSAEDQRERGNREAIMMDQARRGMGGSGTQLASLLANNQGSANRGRDASLDIAAQARNRALQALNQSAGIGGQMRGQDINTYKANEDAAREREMFNAKMRFAATQGNNESKLNEAQLRMKKAAMLAQAKQAQRDRYIQRAKQTQGDYASVGRGMNNINQIASEGSQAQQW